MKRFFIGLLCAAACAFAPLPSSAIILLGTGDPARNTANPGDGSGWQYEGLFGGFLGTPVGPYYFLSAAHIGNQGAFVFHGEVFNVVQGFGDNGTDLVLWQVDHPFAAYAPLFTASTGAETGRELRVFGRGTQRGGALTLNGTARGWAWGPGDAVERWGTNVVADLPVSGAAQYLHATFDASGSTDEAHLSVGDSGGGLFVQEAGLWKLAAINYAVDDLYTGPDASTGFTAAVYDARGYYTQNDDHTFSLIPDGGVPVPTGFYSTRVANRLAWLHSITGVDPTVLPPETFAAWQTLFFTPAQRSDAAVSGPQADPDGDGVPNLLEYAFNLDPTFPAPLPMTADTGLRGLPLIRLETIPGTADTRLTVEFVRRTAASGANLAYQAQFATDLAAGGNWQSGGTAVVTTINTRWERVKVTDTVPVGSTPGRRFARVLVTSTNL